ncbi:hypothetical protein AVEN_1723-1 [Araneus ventricosus]|uniref:Uncharacterized protein n=1 Tax=Araneus ventricosus TaxID=182803 RepID=A0A4Y2HVK1_ARAVE|nr:hypothetical protein AVEN_1723-1 [Araneus ventricosus]
MIPASNRDGPSANWLLQLSCARQNAIDSWFCSLSRMDRALAVGAFKTVAVFLTGVRGAFLLPRESRRPQSPFSVYSSAKLTAN